MAKEATRTWKKAALVSNHPGRTGIPRTDQVRRDAPDNDDDSEAERGLLGEVEFDGAQFGDEGDERGFPSEEFDHLGKRKGAAEQLTTRNVSFPVLHCHHYFIQCVK